MPLEKRILEALEDKIKFYCDNNFCSAYFQQFPVLMPQLPHSLKAQIFSIVLTSSQIETKYKTFSKRKEPCNREWIIK